MNTQIKTGLRPERVLFALAFAAALTGCGGGGGSSSTGSSLTLGVTDAPVDGVTQVVVEFTKVQVHTSAGATLTFDLPTPKQIDLMALAGGKHTLLLDHQSLAAGQYDWIRLYVNESNSYVMTTSGGQQGMTIPSNPQTGLKLNHPFTLTADGVASFVIDFNLRQSLHMANSQYILRPTLRIVDATTTGSIGGTVSASLITAQGCADSIVANTTVGGAVYVYSGADATTVDVNTTLTSGQPLTSASVMLQSDGTGTYTAAYLDPGVYTVAFTCQSTLDFPDTTDNAVVFQNAANVTVTSGPVTIHNMP